MVYIQICDVLQGLHTCIGAWEHVAPEAHPAQRPKDDVPRLALVKLSVCYRDSFQNVVELMDDMFQRAAAADEPEDMNWVRVHAQALQQSGQDSSAAAARLFSNPAGDYGSMVNERVGASNWSDSKARCPTVPATPVLPPPFMMLLSSTRLQSWA